MELGALPVGSPVLLAYTGGTALASLQGKTALSVQIALMTLDMTLLDRLTLAMVITYLRYLGSR